MTAPNKGTPKFATPQKPRRTDQPELRREIGDCWHVYLTRLARCGADDAEAVRLLDAMITAVSALRDTTQYKLKGQS